MQTNGCNKRAEQAEVPAKPLHALLDTISTSLLARRSRTKVVHHLLGLSSITVTLTLYTASLDELGVE